MQSLRIFVAAYEEGSFTVAAKRESTTQPGVSQHVKNLEQRYGVPLFRREKGKVFPTPAADQFYQHCIEALRSTDAALSVLGGYSKGVSGETSVGIMPTLSAGALAPTLLELRATHPNIKVHILDAYSSVLVDSVLNGELDCAIVPAMSSRPGLRVTPFFRCKEMFVTRKQAGAQGSAQLDSSFNLKIVLPEAANVRADHIRSYLAENNVVIQEIIELNTMMATLDLVAQSEWCAILPAPILATRFCGQTFSVHKLTPEFALKLVVIEPARRNRSPVTDLFLKVLRLSCEALVGPEPYPE